MAVDCLLCAVGYHFECSHPTDKGECHCTTEIIDQVFKGDGYSDEPVEKKERGGQIKEAADVKDLESTGRKRAARLYPIPKEGQPGYPMRCEWQGLVSAGGGVYPITGCIEGMAKSIHHGPDKNTLSNFVGNVHRICHTCHNRWHTLNDPTYSGERPSGDTPYLPVEEYQPHDGMTKATGEDIARSELMWIDRKTVRATNS